MGGTCSIFMHGAVVCACRILPHVCSLWVCLCECVFREGLMMVEVGEMSGAQQGPM